MRSLRCASFPPPYHTENKKQMERIRNLQRGVEKWNDMAVAERRKPRGMSWTENSVNCHRTTHRKEQIKITPNTQINTIVHICR
ncbi:MAG: hypothetical protein LBC02_13110 [Planctomycetaceae bacterium]|jgi:hypothetical protein|nr:hypothetical protein [Planctomycetaceae bacterium]